MYSTVESVFINKCLGFKWKFIGQRGEWIKACELALYVVAALLPSVTERES